MTTTTTPDLAELGDPDVAQRLRVLFANLAAADPEDFGQLAQFIQCAEFKVFQDDVFETLRNADEPESSPFFFVFYPPAGEDDDF